MIRKAFLLSVHPGQIDEYRRRHSPIWPELAAVLKAHGVHHYAIFHDPVTNLLFGSLEIEDEARWQAIAQTEVGQRWWRHMSSLMPSEPGGRPIGRDLTEVFYLP